MDNEQQIMQALGELSQSGKYHIVEMSYDDKSFGNVVVDIQSNYGVSFRYIRDRGVTTCEIGSTKHPDDLFSLDDVMTVIGSPTDLRDTDMIETLNETIRLIERNKTKVTDAFSNEHYQKTRDEIQKLEDERVRELFDR